VHQDIISICGQWVCFVKMNLGFSLGFHSMLEFGFGSNSTSKAANYAGIIETL